MTQKKYLGNTNTKEIHEFKKMEDKCKFSEMKDEDKLWLDYGYEVILYCVRKKYNGCKWCLPEYYDDVD